MLWVRRVWEVVIGLSAGLWIGRIVFDWILGVDGTWLWVPIVALGLVGGLIGGVAALACLLLPMPWGVIAAVALAALTVAALRAIPKPPEPAD